MDQLFRRGDPFARRWVESRPDVYKSMLKLFPDNAVVFITRARHNRDFAPVASSVDHDSEWVSYKYTGTTWEQVDEVPVDSQSAVVSVALLENARLKEQVKDLQSKNSQAALEYSLLRHDYERIRPAAPQPYKWGKIFLYAFVVGLLVSSLPMSHAWPEGDPEKSANHPVAGSLYPHPQDDDYQRSSFTFDNLRELMTDWNKKAFNYTLYRDNLFREYLTIKDRLITYESSPVIKVFLFFRPYWSLWFFSSLTFLFQSYGTSNWLVASLIVILSLKTGDRTMGLIPVPWMTTTGAWVHLVLMLVSLFDALGALFLSLLYLFCAPLVYLWQPDETFFSTIRSSTLVAISNLLTVLSRNIPGCDILCLSLVVVWRIYQAWCTVGATRLEIKTADGKTAKVVSLAPSFFQRARRKFRQATKPFRAPSFPIPSNCLVHITTDQGSGTGFRTGNYLVTARHVVAGATSTEVSVGSLTTTLTSADWIPLGERDIVKAKLPSLFQHLSSVRVADKSSNDWIGLLTFAPNGSYYQLAVGDGLWFDDTLTYALDSDNGSSGSPVIDRTGKVVAVHTMSTGYTASGQRLVREDVENISKVQEKDREIEKLKAELEALRTQPSLQQSDCPQEVVDLVREAVRQEMLRLRLEFAQAKGKNKRGRGRKHNLNLRAKRVGKQFTEQEYRRLQEEGWTKDDLRDMAYQLWEETQAENAGYGDWSDPEWSDDASLGSDFYEEALDFDQRKVAEPAEPDQALRDEPNEEKKKPGPFQQCQLACRDPMLYEVDTAEYKVLGEPMHEISRYVNELQSLTQEEYTRKATYYSDALREAWDRLNGYCVHCGFKPFSQRKMRHPKPRQQPKNLPTDPSGWGREEISLHYWLSMLQEPKPRFLVHPDFPLVGFLPINRPLYDASRPRDPLLGLLPPISVETGYAPATWGPQAFINSFEKFQYAQPPDFVAKNPQAHQFALSKLRAHYSFLQGTAVIPITATDKETNSTPAYPKNIVFRKESDFLDHFGWGAYVDELKHLQYKPVLWYLFLKKEILKESKIQAADIRQILCADPIYGRIGLMFDQQQNVRVKERTHDKSSQVGWTPFFGGFQQRIQRLASTGARYWVEVDWTRYDGTIPQQLLRIIRQVRWEFLDDVYKTAENRKLYEWYVHNLLNRYVLLPSGEVTFQDRGNPSGQVSTSVDNGMVNYYLQAYEHYVLNGPDGWEDTDTLIYGDDRLSVTNFPPDPEELINFYHDYFGMWVKKENIKVQETPVGLSFCGFTITEDLKPCLQRPMKLLASILTPVTKLRDPEVLYGKLLSMLILSHNDPPDSPLRRYVRRCVDILRARVGSDLPVFSDRILSYLWGGGPKRDDGQSA
nr:ORF1ab [Porcine astrovirus 5]BAX00267.1 ORF1ab [Porcine astrovirus 5]